MKKKLLEYFFKKNSTGTGTVVIILKIPVSYLPKNEKIYFEVILKTILLLLYGNHKYILIG